MTLEHPPGTPRPVRLDAGRFALWVFLATEVMFFTALIASYLVLRAGAVARDGMPWPRAQEVHVDPLIGLINTFVLIASSGCAMVACKLLASGSSRGATTAVGLSFVLGCVFLGVKGYEYRSKFNNSHSTSSDLRNSTMASCPAKLVNCTHLVLKHALATIRQQVRYFSIPSRRA